jgi:microcystin-dependent protein
MTPSIGEIRAFGGNFAPRDWALCQGQLLPISEFNVLFTLLGTTYGGDGVNTFALPNLQGRLIANQGQGAGRTNRILGEQGGAETVTLQTLNLPSHNHSVMASTNGGNANVPTNNYLAAPLNVTKPTDNMQLYMVNTFTGKTIVPLNSTTVVNTGGNLPHENLMPYLTINYIISLAGVFPSPS